MVILIIRTALYLKRRPFVTLPVALAQRPAVSQHQNSLAPVMRVIGLWTGCFAAPRDLRFWNKVNAKLLGAACSNVRDLDVRNALFPDHPSMPPGCSIKGTMQWRAKFTQHRGIYHLEGCRSYRTTTNPRRWFCSEEQARAEGFRKAYTCRKGT